MSAIIPKSDNFNIQCSIQNALGATSNKEICYNTTVALIKAVASTVFSPLINFGLMAEAACSCRGSKAATHLINIFIDPIRSAITSAALSIALIASPFFSLKGVNRLLPKIYDGVHELHNEKYNTILTQYKAQLGETLDSLITEVKSYPQTNSIAKPLLECLQSLTNTTDPRASYKRFVSKLDEVATFIEKNKLRTSSNYSTLRCIEIAETLAINRWAGVNMEDHFKERIDLAEGKITEPQLLSEFPSKLRDINHLVEHSSPAIKKSSASLAFQKLSGTAGVENFTGNRNTPNLLALMEYNKQDGSTQTIKYLRHGSPTHGKDFTLRNSSEGITPNYELFLYAAASRGQGVFYAIHQRLTSGGFDDESGRTKAILTLQKKHPNFHAMVQPVEGKFFNKTGSTHFRNLFTELQDEFFSNTDKPSCRLPSAVMYSLEYKTAFQTIFKTVKETFFADNHILTETERKQFILYFYALQRMDLKMRLGETSNPISYYVTACKDDLDRGGSQALLELVLHLIMTGQENNPEQLSHLVNHLIGPPIVIKHIGMLSRRLEQVLPAIEYIIKNDEIMNKLKDLNFSGNTAKSVTFSGAAVA